MAVLTDVGYVARPGEDFASTGPHLDVRVLKDGKYINPETIRSLLTRLKVGKEQTPLWQQQGDKWQSAAPITSGFGPRVAPTAGASTFHPAHDYGFGAGTPLAWEGPGTFTPGKGYGSIKTTDPQGNPYEIRLLHTKGGKPAEVASTAQALPQTTEDPGKKQLAEYLQKNTELLSQLVEQSKPKDETTGTAGLVQKLMSSPGSSANFLNTAIAAASEPTQYV